MAGLLAVVFVLLAAVAGRRVGRICARGRRAGDGRGGGGPGEPEADRARAAEHEIRRQWYAASVNLMQPAWDAGQVGRLRELLTATETHPDRGFEWYYWRRLCHLERSDLIGHRAGVRSVCWSPDGKRLATASWDGTARVWDADGREILALRGASEPGQFRRLVARRHPAGDGRLGRDGADLGRRPGPRVAPPRRACGPGLVGRLVAGRHPAGDGGVRTGRRACGTPPAAAMRLALEGHAGDVVSAAWSPDGKSLATASADGTARVWDAADGPRVG